MSSGEKHAKKQTEKQPETESPDTKSEAVKFGVVKSEVFVIQKYLEQPLLIDSRKFDIRLWVLVGVDNRCYLFREGYIRTSSYAFTNDSSSIDKPFIHLTNNAVQKHDHNYGKLEEGN